jgi:hypothetical protein
MMCNGNCCPARDPQNGPCPQRCIDHHECMGDHGCECLGEQALKQALMAIVIKKRMAGESTIPQLKPDEVQRAIKETLQECSPHQTKAMTPEEEAEFQAAAKAAGLPCGDD